MKSKICKICGRTLQVIKKPCAPMDYTHYVVKTQCPRCQFEETIEVV